MSDFPWDQTIFGWIHIFSAAVVVGGLVFWAVARAAAVSGNGGFDWERAALARFRPLFWTAALLLLVTGGYTWSVRARQGYPGFYFHVVYTKVLLYVILFGVAGMITKWRETPNGLQKGGVGLKVCIAVCAIILFLSAFMRRVQPLPAQTPVSGTIRAVPTVVSYVPTGGEPTWRIS
jgi:uncharacterized membrane protein